MGGKAAKERRRLARLVAAANQGGDREQSATASLAPNPSNKNAQEASSRQPSDKRNQRNRQKKPPRPPFASSRTWPADNGGGDGDRLLGGKRAHGDKPIAEPKTKKLKLKKPKHLKRKIDKLSEEGNGEEREKLVNQLNQFQARKAAMAKPVTLRKTPTPADTSHSRKAQNDYNAVDKKGLVTHETPCPVDTTMDDDNDPKSREKEPAVAGVSNVAASLAPKEATLVEDGSDSDSDICFQDAVKRQRGRRRRGRKSTEEQHARPRPTNETEAQKVESVKVNVAQEAPKMTTENASDPLRKTAKRDDKRRCIGRKPVTDFVVGQRYTGKVVYTKQFGAFIDIRCHSDAFCHVSRVRDDYVNSIDEVLSIGQEVNARVVEVDRKAKRITVSLQSDARMEDERASIEARKERKGKNAKRNHLPGETSYAINTTSSAAPPPSPPTNHGQPVTSPPAPLDESTMTPAELKRARKLARRAARREQQARTGIAA